MIQALLASARLLMASLVAIPLANAAQFKSLPRSLHGIDLGMPAHEFLKTFAQKIERIGVLDGDTRRRIVTLGKPSLSSEDIQSMEITFWEVSPGNEKLETIGLTYTRGYTAATSWETLMAKLTMEYGEPSIREKERGIWNKSSTTLTLTLSSVPKDGHRIYRLELTAHDLLTPKDRWNRFLKFMKDLPAMGLHSGWP